MLLLPFHRIIIRSFSVDAVDTGILRAHAVSPAFLRPLCLFDVRCNGNWYETCTQLHSHQNEHQIAPPPSPPAAERINFLRSDVEWNDETKTKFVMKTIDILLM